MAVKEGSSKKETTGFPGQKDEGHGDNTQPAGVLSPATYVPLATEPTNVNVKTEYGKKGTPSS